MKSDPFEISTHPTTLGRPVHWYQPVCHGRQCRERSVVLEPALQRITIVY
jgi:hypothetical protein